MPVQFTQLGQAESVARVRPEPSILNTRPDSAEAAQQRIARPAESGAADTLRPVQQPAAEARIAFDGGERVDRRDAGAEVAEQSRRAGVAQQARAVARQGRDDLATLDALARDADRRQVEQADVDRLRERLREADRDPSVQEARREVEDARLEAEAEAAEADARDAAREVLERPSIPDQPTLALVPKGVGAPPEERAAEAEAEARLARGRAERADVRRSVLGPADRPVFEPRVADVGDAEAARETRDAVAEADGRAARLEEQLARFEEQAAVDARRATEAFGERSGRRVPSSRDADQTAREVARSTLDDPARALATQPYLSVEAALRVLA